MVNTKQSQGRLYTELTATFCINKQLNVREYDNVNIQQFQIDKHIASTVKYVVTISDVHAHR